MVSKSVEGLASLSEALSLVRIAEERLRNVLAAQEYASQVSAQVQPTMDAENIALIEYAFERMIQVGTPALLDGVPESVLLLVKTYRALDEWGSGMLEVARRAIGREKVALDYFNRACEATSVAEARLTSAHERNRQLDAERLDALERAAKVEGTFSRIMADLRLPVCRCKGHDHQGSQFGPCEHERDNMFCVCGWSKVLLSRYTDILIQLSKAGDKLESVKFCRFCYVADGLPHSIHCPAHPQPLEWR